MANIVSQGVQFLVGDGASPEVFTAVAQLKSIGDLDLTRSKIDTTLLSSLVTTAQAGLTSVSDIAVVVNYDDSEATQSAFWTKITTAQQSDVNYRIDLDDGSPSTTFTFAAQIVGFRLTGFTTDSLQEGEFTLAINSEPTKA